MTGTSWPVDEWRALHESGVPWTEIGKRYGVRYDTVSYHVRDKVNPRTLAHAETIRASKHEPRCRLCEIILERDDCVGHGADSPMAVFCWMCREDYPEQCQQAEGEES